METSSRKPGIRFPATAILMLVMLIAGCQSVPQPPQARPATSGEGSVDPEYTRQLAQISAALSDLPSGVVPVDAEAYVRQARQLRSVGDGFLQLSHAGPATGEEYRLWGAFFNRLADTVEAVVNGDVSLAEAERLYDDVARLYPLFLDRSHLPERPFVAVQGETSAYYAGDYFLCTMPELIADAYGRRKAVGMGDHLARAMARYLAGPCEPDLMFSAAEMLYDYALVSGANQADYRERIEQAGPGKSEPWLILVDNLTLADSRTRALANLERALAEARADLEDGDEVSVEFSGEAERQRRLLNQESGALRALPYRP